MSTLQVFELVVSLTVAQRLAELALSRARERRLSSAAHRADSTAAWRALVAAQSLWLCGSAIEPALRGRVAPTFLFAAGLAVFVLGDLLRLSCIVALGPAWNARAAVDPGLRVVSSGPYRWIRHPNYLGVLLELVGLPLAGGAWWTLALALPPHLLILRRRMRGEDRLLFALPGYAAAMGGKGALLPRPRLR